MKTKLTDSEIIIMNILWESGPLKAGEIAEITLKKKGWKRNTTYTLIQRLIKKDAILRTDPNFICTPILKQDEIRIEETKTLLDKMYNGSFNLLVKNFIKKESLSQKEIDELRNIIDEVDK
ncbi:BlaI/MecI/CopY family transcriptional regulator [Maledivibacter halophilus]|uniref:Predicted transcriptional regulator n=1 Tax=Maledivibacter halophilus TaxID=36842 RepID=A0A1T5MMS6_9FIRM|nr:BlaI/MecI/CopY family transcriptional regulator [Maledivibacter halophilus]SKC89314.1 Predicted transcriptional regulator [Maledivibacter halophilus]